MEILRIQRQIHKNLHLNLSNNIKSYNIIYIWTIEIFVTEWLNVYLQSIEEKPSVVSHLDLHWKRVTTDWLKVYLQSIEEKPSVIQSPGFALETCYDWRTEELHSVVKILHSVDYFQHSIDLLLHSVVEKTHSVVGHKTEDLPITPDR